MSTILDALKKVERERESPGDRLRHEPEPPRPRSRRVSTVTIAVCAILGFGAGAGIALRRNTAPLSDESPVAPRIEVPAAETDVAPAEPSLRVGLPPAVAPLPEVDADSALEPSPFTSSEELAVAALPVPGADPAPPAMPREDAAQVAPEPAIVAALPPGPIDAAPQAAETLYDDAPVAVPAVEDGVGEDEGDAASDAAPPPEPSETLIDTGRSPPGVPQVTLSFLQWSSDPARRFAFVSVDGGPSQRVLEGDAAGAATVDRIAPDGIHLRHANIVFVIRPRH